jgi:hypothetical protein
MLRTRMAVCICDWEKWLKGVPKYCWRCGWMGGPITGFEREECIKIIDMIVVLIYFTLNGK